MPSRKPSSSIYNSPPGHGAHVAKNASKNDNVKPTVLIIHDAHLSPAHYGPFIALLNLEGYTGFCPPLPTCHTHSTNNPTQKSPLEFTMLDDATFIRNEISRLANDSNKEVVVLMHGYGGIVGTQAVDKSFSKRSRGLGGKKGGVRHLVFVAGLLLGVGCSFFSSFAKEEEDLAGGGLGWDDVFRVLDDGRLKLRNPEILFAGSVVSRNRRKWTDLITKTFITPTRTTLSYLAYQHIPTTYIFCNYDSYISLTGQRRMVDAVVEAGGKVREVDLMAGHCPFLSHGFEVLRAVGEALCVVELEGGVEGDCGGFF